MVINCGKNAIFVFIPQRLTLPVYHKVGDMGDMSPYKSHYPAYKECSYVVFLGNFCTMFNLYCTLCYGQWTIGIVPCTM